MDGKERERESMRSVRGEGREVAKERGSKERKEAKFYVSGIVRVGR